MSREIRTRVRPWTQGPPGQSEHRGRSRRRKVNIVVPPVDTYRTHMEHVQMLYSRLRLADDPEQQSSFSSSSTALPPLPLYAMKRSHTFVGVPSRHQRESSDPRVNPLPYRSLLEFSSMAGSSSRGPSLQSSSAESLVSSKLSQTTESLSTEDGSASYHRQVRRQNKPHHYYVNKNHHRFLRKSLRRSSRANPHPHLKETWVDDSNEQGIVSRDSDLKEGETENGFRHEESHFPEAIEFQSDYEDLESKEHAKTPTLPETDDDMDTLRGNAQSPEYIRYPEGESLTSQHPHNRSQTLSYPDDVSESFSVHSSQRNGWTNPAIRQQQIHKAAAVAKKTIREGGASSSGVSSKSSSCHEADGSKGPSLGSSDREGVARSAEEQNKDHLNRLGQQNGGEKEHKRVKHERVILRKVGHTAGEHSDYVEHSEDSNPRLSHDNDEHQSRKQSEKTDHADKEGIHYLSFEEPQVDIIQLCEHLKTQGLGDPVMSTQSHIRTHFSNKLPPGVKARCLPRNPSKREKIKGRARLDCELANMRAVAFCEQSKVFRTASADLRDRDLRLLEEEERENLKKSLEATAKDNGWVVPDPQFNEQEDDESSIVGNPLSREELFLRIDAWAEDVYNALSG